jgi:hypothetical protein
MKNKGFIANARKNENNMVCFPKTHTHQLKDILAAIGDYENNRRNSK